MVGNEIPFLFLRFCPVAASCFRNQINTVPFCLLLLLLLLLLLPLWASWIDIDWNVVFQSTCFNSWAISKDKFNRWAAMVLKCSNTPWEINMLNPNNGGAWFRCFSFLWLDGTTFGTGKILQRFSDWPQKPASNWYFCWNLTMLRGTCFFPGGRGPHLQLVLLAYYFNVAHILIIDLYG